MQSITEVGLPILRRATALAQKSVLLAKENTELAADVERFMGGRGTNGSARPGLIHERKPPRRRRRRAASMTRWSADTAARRVPLFVIEATGLDTKKKIVARYGANARFENGKPLPAPLQASANAARASLATRAGRAARHG